MIINRAFIREVVTTAIAVTIIIITIFLVVRVMGFLSQAAEGLIPLLFIGFTWRQLWSRGGYD